MEILQTYKSTNFLYHIIITGPDDKHQPQFCQDVEWNNLSNKDCKLCGELKER